MSVGVGVDRGHRIAPAPGDQTAGVGPGEARVGQHRLHELVEVTEPVELPALLVGLPQGGDDVGGPRPLGGLDVSGKGQHGGFGQRGRTMGGRPQQHVTVLGQGPDATDPRGVEPDAPRRGLGDLRPVGGPIGGLHRQEGDEHGVDIVESSRLESQRVVAVQRAQPLDRPQAEGGTGVDEDLIGLPVPHGPLDLGERPAEDPRGEQEAPGAGIAPFDHVEQGFPGLVVPDHVAGGNGAQPRQERLGRPEPPGQDGGPQPEDQSSADRRIGRQPDLVAAHP